MQLSVIILNYNVRYFLELCLQSVQQATANLDAEIIVVDNNSPDDSCAMVKQKFPHIDLIENKENVGFAKANNQAVATAKGQYICILNPDTVVGEATFENCIKKAKLLPDLGIMGVQLLDGKGIFLPESKRNLPTPKVSLFKMFGSRFSHIAPYYANHVDKDAEGQVSVLVGAFMFVEKIKYVKAAGFDERYFMYGEDIDFSYTMEKLGYKNYYLGSETIIHFKGESSFKDKIYRKRFFGAMQLFYEKHFKSSVLMNGFVFLGIRTASLLKTNKKTQTINNFSAALLISDNEALNHKITLKLQLPSHVISAQALLSKEFGELATHCFLDMNYLSYSDAIQLVVKCKTKNSYFRFLPKSTHFALGSDSSTGLGIVISYS